jgi:ATP synthase protein I
MAQWAPERTEPERAMTVHAPKDRLGEFEARLNRLKGETPQSGEQAGSTTAGYGLAFTIAADLVGGLIGGAVAGWLADYWFGTGPWMLITFFFLGAAAGMWNVYRTVRGYDRALGFRSSEPAAAARGKEMKIPAVARPEEEGGERGGQSTSSVRNQYDRPDSNRRD